MKRIFAVVSLVSAGMSAAAQQSIRPRPLGAIQATSEDVLGVATLARELPGGGVLVNDPARRRLLLFDKSLQSFTVVADSTAGSANGYGQRPGALVPYVADSTLYLDVTAGSFLVIDPAGKVTRVMSPPRPSDNAFLASTATGFPGFDARGRLVYRTMIRPPIQQTRDGGIQMGQAPDSQPLLRVDLDTRQADTIGYLKVARQITSSGTSPTGGTFMMRMDTPLATIDDWALLSDGSVAIIRGRDYHIDWIAPDGSKRASEKVSFDWRRLSDEDKLAIVDSISKARANGPAMGGAGGAPTMMFGAGGGGGTQIMMGGGPVVSTRESVTQMVGAATATASTSPSAPVAAGAAASTTASKPADAKNGDANGAPAAKETGGSAQDKAVADRLAQMGMPSAMPLSASDLPDYMPPFTNSSARPDADAHLWIRTTTPGAATGNIVYDVVNNVGALVDRVDVPKGMTIVGFGKGGVVFLSQRDGTGVRLLRALIH
jgi:hypothetical protein